MTRVPQTLLAAVLTVCLWKNAFAGMCYPMIDVIFFFEIVLTTFYDC